MRLLRYYLRIFVHPFFEEYSSRDIYEHVTANEKSLETSRRISSLLQTDSESKPPVLIMEDHRYIEETTRRIQTLGVSQTVYIIETYSSSGVPRLKDSMGNDASINEEWNQFHKLLQEVGVKRILLGGMNFEVSKVSKYFQGERDADYILEQMMKKGAKLPGWETLQCVGKVANRLAEEFDVEISNLTSPTGRLQFHRFIRKRPRKDC